MKKIILAKLCASIVMVFMFSSLYAANQNPPLNQVMLQLQAEKWAVASTAKVIVNINASLASADLANIHAEIMQNLQKISADTAWHITRFYRSQGQSGLEQLEITAETRLPEKALTNLRQKALKVSKPGEKYTIANILFSPSLQEIEKVQQQLREELYSHAFEELQRLNKVFSQQHFVLHNISFVSAPVRSLIPQMNAFIVKKDNAQPALTVSDKITLNATVVFAANMPSDK